MRYLLSFFIVLSSYVVTAQDSQQSKLVAKGATPVLVASDYKFTEGPAVDGKGNVFFTDQPNNRILKWTPGAGVTVFMENAGRSNGLYFDRAGNLLACADEKNELWLIDPNKNVTVLVRDYKGKKLNGPNDLWVDSKGGVYLTDPFYKRDYWTRTEKEIESENVYYLSPDRKKLTMVMDGFKRPNGIVGTPDGKKLYVADIGDAKTYVFDIGRDGSLSNRRLIAPMGSDGMTLDSKGNIYLTGKGVTIFDVSGKQVGHIPIAEPWTANVCFGGNDGKTLFITASKSVYTVAMKVKGANQ
ncbi:MAG: SMP-30/gluconolactonase/LRE family protein [Bacteroidota bacterium]|nr:SMP-30/gluconolactonase/LRE family protein [Bacteroidota bacterium]